MSAASRLQRQTLTPESPDTRAPEHLTGASLHKGTVTHCNSQTKLFDVQLSGRNETLKNCVWAGGVFSSLIGMKTSYMPPTGSNVLVLYDGQGYVLGMLPSDMHDPMAAATRTLTGVPEAAGAEWLTQEEADAVTPYAGGGAAPGVDALEGEYELGNALGVAISLLTTMSRMQAGDRAKVECFLLNDMVRIVSENFRHFSSFGNMEIYNDGRLNVRFDGTSYEHEAWGLLKARDPKVPMEGQGVVDFSSIESMAETGRWRFSEFIGFLGDFFHQIVSDPVDAVGRYAMEAARSGKARFQVMSDGTMLMQSVSDIVLERVTRVQVPKELCRWEDPTGDRKRDMTNLLHREYLRIWKDAAKPTELSKACYQLREYARWLNQYHSFARFMQLTKDWEVPSEAGAPIPDPNNAEDDRRSVNPDVAHIDTYSTFRIMRDGSQVHFDGWGNSIVTSQMGVQIGSPRHIELVAGGDIILNSGQNVRIKARRSIDLVAVVGGIRMKARAFWQALCELGTIWIKGDAPKTAESGGEEVAPENFGQAVRIEGTQAPVAVRAGQGFLLDANEGSVSLQARKGAVNIIANGEDEDGKKGLSLRSDQPIGLHGDAVLVHSRLALLGHYEFKVGTNFSVRGGKINARQLNVNTLNATAGIRGPLRPGGSDGHKNHIGVIPDDYKIEFSDDDAPLPAPSLEDAGKHTWRFSPRSEYMWDAEYHLRQSLSQQFMALKDKLPGGVDPPAYGLWLHTQDRLLEAPQTSTSNLPWPGGASHEVYTGGESLHTPSEKAPSEHTAVPQALQTEPTVLYYIKQ